ncbi:MULTISPECIES: ABC transporter permease subunit [unclassified Marinitoga]|uniref:ABC transporter permease subunit n=1 Tax=unclassified Marinitoga TaxID=2640159 RepID=UPI000640D0D7|nr:MULTISPECIES: ABC transporter permease subunit [unclassified Marinitoga]KLO22459.1 hypothetical protein X274_08145 [Marinitoga sp. 1155]NUV00254.1 ABC transporter permease [Marinitoga sp. 1154]
MKKEFYEMRVRFLILFIITIILFFSIAPFQKIYVNMIEENITVIKPYAEKFGIANMIENLNDWNYYIYTQWFGKNFGQMLPIFAIIAAFPLFSREFENGTMEYLMVRKSRDYIFLSKVYSGLVLLFLLIIFGSLLPVIYSNLFNKDFNSVIAYKFMIHGLFGVLFWYDITVFFSIFFNDQVKPILSSIGLLAITTALGFIKPLNFLNTYIYILGNNILKYGKIDWTYSIYLFVLGEIIASLAYYTFKNKEI